MAGRARAGIAKNNPQLEDRSWMTQVDCEYCGRVFCNNNYPDKRPRTTKFLGLRICAFCDPRHVDDRWLWRRDTKGKKPRITHPVVYRTIISTWLVRKLLLGVDPVKIEGQAEKFWDIDGMPIPTPKGNRDPTKQTDEQIYGRN